MSAGGLAAVILGAGWLLFHWVSGKDSCGVIGTWLVWLLGVTVYMMKLTVLYELPSLLVCWMKILYNSKGKFLRFMYKFDCYNL